MREEVAHVTREEQLLRDRAEQWKGRGEDKAVAHACVMDAQRFEEVVVLHGVEGTFEHGVLEVGGTVKGSDAAGEVLADAEVGGAPADELAHADETCRDAGDGLFPGLFGAEEVNLDAS